MVDTLLIDAEHPWPWLDAYPEKAEQFFNGRDQDSEALLRCVLAAPVTVLFSKSGLGKSSLLQAGLFPRLRNERLFPVYVRLNHDERAASASEQIAKHFREQLKESFPQAHAQLTETNLDESLWMQLHRAGIELRDADGRRWTPVFVVDQFEEIFTLGATNPERQKQVFYELGDLMENRIPKALAEKLNSDEGDSLYEQFNLDTQPYRFVLSLREDYLPDLEEWTDLIPRLGPNRYRLLPMSNEQAKDAIIKTGGALVTAEDADNIVYYLSSKQSSAESEPNRQRTQAQVEPTLLSLMCSGLNDKRLKAGQSKLATNNLAQEGSRIVEHFYDAAFTGLPESMCDFVEQCLITPNGVRLSYPVRSVETEKLATAEQIQTLINKRLIRRENLEEGDRIELVHDHLAQVALQRRQDRQKRKEALRQQQLRRRWVAGIVTIMIMLIGFAWFMAEARQKALKAEANAVDAKVKAEHAFLDATAMRLAVEGEAMTSGLRPDGTIQGLFKVLAGHRLSRSANTDEALQTEYLKFNQQKFVREGQTGIFSTAFNPDGTQIVSGGGDGMIRLWNAKNGEPIGQPLKGHKSLVTMVAFSPDGTRIISVSWDRILWLWDAQTGQSIEGPFYYNNILSVAFNLNGTFVVAGSGNTPYRGSGNPQNLWVSHSNQPIFRKPFIGHEYEVLSVAFSPDGSRIVSGSADNTLRLWDVFTGQPIGEPYIGHDDKVLSVAFSPDGSRIVSGSADNTLRLWDVFTGQPIGKPLKGHTDSVSSAAFSLDGTRIVSGSRDRTLRLWDANTGQPIGQPLTGHTHSVMSVAFSSDGTSIVSGSSDGTLRLWDVNTDESIGQPLNGHDDAVFSVAFSPDGNHIVSGGGSSFGGGDNSLRLWDAHTSQLIGQPINGHVNVVAALAFSPDNSRIVSGSWDGTLRLWNAHTGHLIGQPLKGHDNAVFSVAFSPNGTRIVSGGGDFFQSGDKDNSLRLWDTNTGRPIGQPLKSHNDAVFSVAFSPDGTRIVSGGGNLYSGADNSLQLWDTHTGQPTGQPLKGHDGRITSIAFSPDGASIVSASEDKTLRLWNVYTGQPIGQPLKGHDNAVLSVAFSPDGTRIVSGGGGFLGLGGSDNSLRLWDVNTGKQIGQPLKGHDGSVNSVAFSPDGNRIVSGSHDKTIRLWDVFDGWADALCKKLGRNMSHQEWQDWVSPDIPYKEQCPGLSIPPDKADAAN